MISRNISNEMKKRMVMVNNVECCGTCKHWLPRGGKSKREISFFGDCPVLKNIGLEGGTVVWHRCTGEHDNYENLWDGLNGVVKKDPLPDGDEGAIGGRGDAYWGM